MDIKSAKLVYQMDYTRYITFLYLCRNVILYENCENMNRSKVEKKNNNNNMRLLVLQLYCVPLLKLINICIHHFLISNFMYMKVN